jgi:hypothetical protein
MFDAVHVVVSAVRELNRSQEIGVKPLACTSANIWPHGTSLMNYLRMVSQEQGAWRWRGTAAASGRGTDCVSPALPLLSPRADCPVPCLTMPLSLWGLCALWALLPCISSLFDAPPPPPLLPPLSLFLSVPFPTVASSLPGLPTHLWAPPPLPLPLLPPC